MKELYRLKKGKGLYGNGQNQITKDDLLLVDKEEDLSNFVKTDDIAAFIKADEIANYTLSSIVNNEVSLLKDEEIISTIDLTPYLDDTNLARILEGTVENGIATFKRSDETEFTVDFSSLIDQFPNRVIERTVAIISEDAPEFPTHRGVRLFVPNISFITGYYYYAPAGNLTFNRLYDTSQGGWTQGTNPTLLAVLDENGELKDTATLAEEFYNTVLTYGGVKLSDWDTWYRDGVYMMIPINGRGAEGDILDIMTAQYGLQRSTLTSGNTTGSGGSILAYYENKSEFIGTREVEVDSEGTEVDGTERFYDNNNVRIYDVLSWRYLKNTSDFVNDGDGKGSYFLTKEEAEITYLKNSNISIVDSDDVEQINGDTLKISGVVFNPSEDEIIVTDSLNDLVVSNEIQLTGFQATTLPNLLSNSYYLVGFEKSDGSTLVTHSGPATHSWSLSDVELGLIPIIGNDEGWFESDVVVKTIYDFIKLHFPDKDISHYSTWFTSTNSFFPDYISIVIPFDGIDSRDKLSDFLNDIRISHSPSTTGHYSVSFTSEVNKTLNTNLLLRREFVPIQGTEVFKYFGVEVGVNSWEYFNRTSQLINDGDGNSSFVTEEKLNLLTTTEEFKEKLGISETIFEENVLLNTNYLNLDDYSVFSEFAQVTVDYIENEVWLGTGGISLYGYLGYDGTSNVQADVYIEGKDGRIAVLHVYEINFDFGDLIGYAEVDGVSNFYYLDDGSPILITDTNFDFNDYTKTHKLLDFTVVTGVTPTKLSEALRSINFKIDKTGRNGIEFNKEGNYYQLGGDISEDTSIKLKPNGQFKIDYAGQYNDFEYNLMTFGQNSVSVGIPFYTGSTLSCGDNLSVTGKTSSNSVSVNEFMKLAPVDLTTITAELGMIALDSSDNMPKFYNGINWLSMV